MLLFFPHHLTEEKDSIRSVCEIHIQEKKNSGHNRQIIIMFDC